MLRPARSAFSIADAGGDDWGARNVGTSRVLVIEVVMHHNDLTNTK